MKPYSSSSLLIVGLILTGALVTCNQNNGPGVTQDLDAEKLFTFQVYPLLESKCFACHGEDQKEIEGDFDIRTLRGMLKGGESGDPALLPGNAEASPIYFAASREDEDFAMPPKDNDKLSQGELNDLFAWIEAGAPWPAENDDRN